MAPCRRPGALLPAPLLLSLLPLLQGCGAARQAGQADPSQAASEALVARRFVQQVVLPGYQQLAQRSTDLSRSLDQLAAHPDAAHLQRARRHWAAARQSWEQAESWAFGPAETQGFDADIDAWPVNEKDLRTLLAGPPATPSLFRSLTSTARGFHAIEAVLHGFTPPPPVAASFSPGQLAYLQLAGADLAVQTRALLQAWQGASGFGARLSAGPDRGQEAIAEILQGMLGTLQEVSAEKLGRPLASRRPADLESAYSGASKADLLANLAGIQASLQRTGLQQLIDSRNANAGRRLAADLAAAEQRLKVLPDPLGRHLEAAPDRARIEAAIQAVDRCADSLEAITEHWG